MDAQTILNTLAGSLAKSLQEVSEARNKSESGFTYAEFTGRMDTLRTILTFIQQQQNLQVAVAEAKQPDGTKVEAKAPKKTPKKPKKTKETK